MKNLISKHKRSLRLGVTGFAMGLADLVPGVSGGTVAFVSGIYEELIAAIKVVSGDALRLFVKGKVREAFGLVPFRFLIPLVIGLGTAIFTLSGVLSYLLTNYEKLVWAFFFGLVAMSTYVVAKRVKTWNWWDVMFFGLAAVFAFWLVGHSSITTTNELWFIFVSGMIAICAMILPGISGSFILVLLGQYSYILESVVTRRFGVLLVFALGCAIGLSLFARVLSWLFRRHHDISVVLLSGFMLGSLRKIWPFGPVGSMDFGSAGVWLLVVLGLMVVFILAKLDTLKERTTDIQSKKFQTEHNKALQEQ